MQDLTQLHTFGLKASALSLFELTSVDDLNTASDHFATSQCWLLGEGSNTVFLADFDGCVVANRLPGIQISDEVDCWRVVAAAGENWHNLVITLHEQGIYGFENLALIPGTVGAAPIQNIGAYGVELADFVETVEYWDIEKRRLELLDKNACKFGYRESVFKRELAGQVLVTAVTFVLPKSHVPVTTYGELKSLNDPTPQHVLEKVISVRRSKLPDPQRIGNAGSFFKNPVIELSTFEAIQRRFMSVPGYQVDASHVKVPAAWLIDTLGFKGRQVGGAKVHERQPLVITNSGNASGEDVLELARSIRDSVLIEFDVHLENEVRLVGSKGLVEL